METSDLLIRLRPAEIKDLDVLGQLFDQYRIFYRQPSNLEAARQFIAERLEQGDSVLIVAEQDDTLIGFTQLYPSFSSVAMRKIWILNDLFVGPGSRGAGVGQGLLQYAADYARENGAIRLQLSTEVTNTVAQTLYERVGYQKNTAFYYYSLDLE